MLLDVDLFFNDSSPQATEQECLFGIVFLFDVLLDLVVQGGLSLTDDELVKFIIYFILHHIKFVFEVLLLLLEELELPSPVSPSEFFSGDVLLLLFVDLELVPHNFDHSHPCSISVVPSSHVYHFREASTDFKLVHSWCDFLMELSHRRGGKEERSSVSSRFQLVLLPSFEDQLFNPWSQRQSFVQSCYDSLMGDQGSG